MTATLIYTISLALLFVAKKINDNVKKNSKVALRSKEC
jgi:hypothetical protein